MKRDWELLRKQMIAIEEGKDLFSDLPELPDHTTQLWDDYLVQLNEFNAIEDRIYGHYLLLIEANYVKGLDIQRNGIGEYIRNDTGARLTMEGHDFLNTMRSPKIWESVKSMAVSKSLELTFDTVKSLATVAVNQIIA